jgi:hypothetical protein
MGVIKQGILGGFSGKVGSVVGTSWKGRAVMKAMPLSVANPRTSLQMQQRNKMTAVVKLARQLLGGAIAQLCNPFAGNISGYNLFVKRNVGFSDFWGVISPEQLVLSEGALGAVVVSGPIQSSIGGTTARFSIASEESPYNLDTDNVMCVVVTTNCEEVLNGGSFVAQRSEAGLITVSLNRPLVSGDTIYVLLAAVRQDKKYASNTTFAYVAN